MVPNCFVKTPLPQDEREKVIIMKIRGEMLDILCEIRPEIYEPYVSFDQKNREKIIYVNM